MASETAATGVREPRGMRGRKPCCVISMKRVQKYHRCHRRLELGLAGSNAVEFRAPMRRYAVENNVFLSDMTDLSGGLRALSFIRLGAVLVGVSYAGFSPCSRLESPRHRRGCWCLSLQPGVFEAPAIEEAVDHHRDPVHARVTAGAEPVLVDDRPGSVLLQTTINLPDQFLALLLIGLDRLLVVHLFELGVAVVGVIALRAASIMLVEIGVRVIDTRP